MTARHISHRYQDPLEVVWLRAAEELGMRVERSRDVYASWDGDKTLTLSAAEDFDADDSLAQLIFHEICHALVAGPAGKLRADWGLCNTGERDLVFEHACHRVQAALAQPYGLRQFFAVTTEWRPYWDALPDNPLEPCDDPALPLAHRALSRATAPPWQGPLAAALEATVSIAALLRELAPQDSLWSTVRARHSSGFLVHSEPGLRCSACAWGHRDGDGLACRQAEHAGRTDVRLEPETSACERWEPAFDAESCARCGACCREGFDRVELGENEVFVARHPELVSTDSWAAFVPRPNKRCVALEGNGCASAYRCRVYADRPRSCAEFEIAGEACLIARRRCNLSI